MWPDNQLLQFILWIIILLAALVLISTVMDEIINSRKHKREMQRMEVQNELDERDSEDR